MDSNKKQNLMDKYATGTLSQAEINEIEKIIGSDPSFITELDMRKDISDSVNIVGNRELRKMLNKLHEDVVISKSATNTKGKIVKLIMSLAAIFLFGLVAYQLGIFKKFGSVGQSETIQYASYYKPDISNSRSSDDIKENYLLPFATAYNKGDYRRVLTIVEPYIANSNNEIKLLTSIAALETGDTRLAIDLLDMILDTNNYYYQDHANWYKALAFLQIENTNEAKIILQKLTQNKNADHHEEAISLLNKLN